MNRAAIFLDRDQTLNQDPGYLSDPAAVRLLPQVGAGLRLLQAQDWPLVLISNQSGVGRGYFSHDDLAAVHARLVALLAQEGVALHAAYYCVHAPSDGCTCRKPEPGMLLQAAHEHNFDLAASVMIGDKIGDAEAGRRAGCRTILISAAPPVPASPFVDLVCADLLEAAKWIEQMNWGSRFGDSNSGALHAGS